MKIDFTLKVKGGSPELLRALGETLDSPASPARLPGTDRAQKAPAPEGTDTSDAVRGSSPNMVLLDEAAITPEEAERSGLTPDDATQAPEPAEQEPEGPDPEETEAPTPPEEQGASTGDPLGTKGHPATLRRTMEAIGRKTTASLKIADATVSPGDYVNFEGDVWVVSVAYRGRALLENEEGQGCVVEAKHLTEAKGRQVPQEGAPEPVEEEPAADPAPETDSDGAVTAGDVRDLYVQVGKTVSQSRANDLMRKLANGKRLPELTPEELSEAADVLREELASFEKGGAA